MDRELMQQALKALQKIYIAPEHEEYIRVWWPACEQAITALRERLAQPEQEPVAWYFVRDLEKGISFAPDNDATKSWQPLYPAFPAATEPVAWMVYTLDGKSVCVTDNPNDFTDQHKALPLYTAPRQWQGLTDEEIEHIADSEWEEAFVRMIEAKLKEKNT